MFAVKLFSDSIEIDRPASPRHSWITALSMLGIRAFPSVVLVLVCRTALPYVMVYTVNVTFTAKLLSDRAIQV